MRRLFLASSIVAATLLALACGGGQTAGTPVDRPSDAATTEAADDGSRAPRPAREAGLVDANELEAGSCEEDVGNPDLAPVLEGPLPGFSATFGPSSRNVAHGGDGNPAGTACIVCHNPGGAGRPFFLAGTVNDTGGTVPPTQVLVREAYGRVLAAQVDQDGNFFLEVSKAPACASVPLRAAVRTATASRAMPDAQRAGNCNGCHQGVTPP